MDGTSIEWLTSRSGQLAVGEVAGHRAALCVALDDRVVVRRSMAAEVLAEVGEEGQRLALRKLLRDPEESVRYRVALSLAPRGAAWLTAGWRLPWPRWRPR